MRPKRRPGKFPIVASHGSLRTWGISTAAGDVRFTSCRLLALVGRLASIAVAWHFVALPAGADEPPAEADSSTIVYQTEIRPILSQRCFKCHGEMVRRGSLRLDEHDFAAKGGESGLPILAPSAQSELFRRIASTNHEDRMPLGGTKLSDEEVKLIGRWLDEGANWPVVTKVDQRSLDFWRRVDQVIDWLEDFYTIFGSLAPIFVALLLTMLVIERGKRYHKHNPRWAGERSKKFFAICSQISAGWYFASLLTVVLAGAFRYSAEAARQRDHWIEVAGRLQKTPTAPGSESGRPQPFRPRHPRRVGGMYYRGNDERNSALFNGGFYRTATFVLSLVDAKGNNLKAGDEVPNGQLAIRLEIRRAAAAAPRLFGEDIMRNAGLDVNAKPNAEEKKNITKFDVVEPGERWAAQYPIGSSEGSSEQRLEGLVYLLDGSSPHYGIEYDLHLSEGRLQNDSELWMGATMLTPNVRVPEEGTVPLSEWFDYREIPEIEGENTTDEVLLGTPEHVGKESPAPEAGDAPASETKSSSAKPPSAKP